MDTEHFYSKFTDLAKYQLEHTLQDYRTNYSYDNPHQLDKECKFDSALQNHIQAFINKHFYKKDHYKNMQFLTEALKIALDIFTDIFDLDDDDIKLVFYNDIILKNLAERFLFTLPNKTMINLSSFFNEHFNQGVFEWKIILHPQLDNYDEIYSKLQFYLARVSRTINEYITIIRQDMFEYFKYNPTYKSYILFELTSELDNILLNIKTFTKMKAAGNEIQRMYIGPGAHTYTFEDNTTTSDMTESECVLLENKTVGHPIQIKIKETSTNTSYFQTLNMITLITNLQHSGNKQMNIAIPCKLFHFTLHHKNDTFTEHFIKSETNIEDFTYTYTDSSKFTFTSVSYKFICELLEKKAYMNEPWTINSYESVYSRLMYFYFIDLFISVTSNRYRNSIVTLFKEYIGHLINNNKEFIADDRRIAEKKYETLLSKYDGKITTKFIKLAQKIHEYNELYFKDAKYKQFLNHLHKNMKIFANIFKSVYGYCTNSNDMFERNLYKGQMKYIV